MRTAVMTVDPEQAARDSDDGWPPGARGVVGAGGGVLPT